MAQKKTSVSKILEPQLLNIFNIFHEKEKHFRWRRKVRQHLAQWTLVMWSNNGLHTSESLTYLLCKILQDFRQMLGSWLCISTAYKSLITLHLFKYGPYLASFSLLLSFLSFL